MTHGGYREGSGRKPILDGGIKRTFVLTPAHLAMIDAWGRAHGTDNRSAALRHLIETASDHANEVNRLRDALDCVTAAAEHVAATMMIEGTRGHKIVQNIAVSARAASKGTPTT